MIYPSSPVQKDSIANSVDPYETAHHEPYYMDVNCYPSALDLELSPFLATMDVPINADITKTCLYNLDPLKPHFYIVKLTLFFLFLLKNIDCGTR